MKRVLKRRTKKSLYLLVVILVLVSTFISPSAVMAWTRTITPIENEYGRNSKFRFSLSSSGEFTYVQHMDNYAFEIRDMANGVMYQTGWITSSSFNPINIMDNLKYDTGLYKFVGFGKSGTTIMDEDYIYYDYVSPWDKLEAPINLRWDGKIARWDANDTRATEYRIYLLDAKDNIITTKNSTTTSYNFAGYNPADGYWFEVAAVSASTSPRYRSSEINESPKYEPTPLTTLNVLVTPAPAAGLTIGDLTVASSNSSKYTVVPGSVCWRLNDSGDCLSNSTTIEAGKTYTLRLTYSSEDGYTIPDDATFNVNGQATEWSGFEAKVNRKINFVIPEDNTRTISVKCYNLYTNEVDSGGDVYLRTDKGGGSWKTKDTRKATLNTNVEINALADDNYEFVEWRKNSPTGQVFKTNSYSTFTATEDVDLYAIFRKKVQRVSYTTHVQSYGWQPYVSNGEMAGTSGEAKRLEAIKIKLENQEYTGNIEYRTHIQSYGWEKSYKKNDEMSGTSGEAKRLEAIQIRLTGEIASYYDVYYRVHAQSFGWLGWARNDEEAGTEGYAKRLEGIEIKLVPKGSIVPGYGTEEAFKYKLVLYTTHVQSYGWQDYAADGEMSGTSGKAKRLEAIKIKLNNQKYTGDIEYMTHIQSYGWEKTWKKNDEMSGTSGEAKRLEAIKIRLTGAMASNYDIYYRVHAQSFGWLNWAKNGEESGTAGYAKRLEGIEIVLVEKGEAPPERSNQNDERAYIQK